MAALAAGWEEAARQAFAAALLAGNPAAVTRAAMDRVDGRPTAVIVAGKAAVGMAKAVRDAGCDAPGIIVTTDENFAEIRHAVICQRPPGAGRTRAAAAAAVMELVAALGEDDHLLLLISGGGSALLPAPADGMTLADKQALNEALLASGLDIHDMNAVRLFSTLKGGRLARWAAPAGSPSSFCPMFPATGSNPSPAARRRPIRCRSTRRWH